MGSFFIDFDPVSAAGPSVAGFALRRRFNPFEKNSSGKIIYFLTNLFDDFAKMGIMCGRG